jgi:uncharacterized membrane protein SpoIIM required for sporulation
MMSPQRRAQGAAVALWLVTAIVVWNGLYDLLLAKSTETYLFEAAMHDAGRGPAVDLSRAMAEAVAHARWIATLWAGILFALGLLTIRLAAGRNAGTVPGDSHS